MLFFWFSESQNKVDDNCHWIAGETEDMLNEEDRKSSYTIEQCTEQSEIVVRKIARIECEMCLRGQSYHHRDRDHLYE